MKQARRSPEPTLRCNEAVLAYLPAEDKDEWRARLLEARPILELISAHLVRELKSNNQSRISRGEFDSPSWAYLQAFHNGIEAGIEKALSAITLTETTDHVR